MGAGDDPKREFDDIDGIVLDDDFVKAAVITESELERRRRARAADERVAEARRREALRRPIAVRHDLDHQAARRDARRRELRRRWLIGTACLAGFALLVAGFFSLPGDDPTGSVRAGSAALPAPGGATLVGEVYSPGDCVAIAPNQETGPEARQTEVVPCSKPHLFEVVGPADIAATDYPTSAEWDAAVASRCTPLVTKVLGHPLSPDSRFVIDALTPTAASWANGADHVMWCTLHPRDASSYVGKVTTQA
ncbi:MAG TPA: septum formation family protein [Acidimicrobiales bacterium]|nr:septum formation family protein [Acidimicrobiales bacterium]